LFALCLPATEKSWERPFEGDAAIGLLHHIKSHYNPLDSRLYAHFSAIVQSSGMGKSRTVDELAKNLFVIPINLRAANSTGGCVFPFDVFDHLLTLFQDFLLQIMTFEITCPILVQKMLHLIAVALFFRLYFSIRPIFFAILAHAITLGQRNHLERK
jgi:hypothetical protein